MATSILPPSKTCTKCGIEYPATREYFYPHKRGRYGLQASCKTCARRYRTEHPEINREALRRYRKTHITERRTYYAEHREEKRIADAAYHKAHPEKRRVQRHKRRAHKLAAEGTHTAADIQAQLKRQKHRCYYAACGHAKLGDTYHVDHVVPLSKGGRNSPDNLVLTCPHCNFSKRDKLPHEFPEGGRLL